MAWLADWLDIILTVGLLALGYFVGRFNEQRHYRSIRTRERALANVMAFAIRFPPDPHTPQRCVLVTGSVVISSDYFKRFVAGLRNLVGGRMSAYESLLDRARREAVLRMKQEALRQGCKLILNVKVESTNVTGGFRGGLPAIEVLAYGTALASL
ncbi:MAG TPA: YbjQ family protein [Burkholderiaceae bacterium]|nr:YbjQ family protein [Burkholderiaceae bacterium]